jgi:hypothetical protein
MLFSAEEPKLLRIEEPSLWPDNPAHMSFSLLRGLEKCPKRWALSSAFYPELWDRNGYPRQINIAELEGIIIHASLELILKEMSVDSMSTQGDDYSVRVLRKLGGISSIIRTQIDGTLSSYAGNPRVSNRLAAFYSQLCNRTEHIRSTIQRHLSRLRFFWSNRQSNNQKGISSQLKRFYSEVGLNALELGWRGRLDLLTIFDNLIEIRDFKTGIPKDDDRSQLQVYAFLWQQDKILNPTGSCVNRLVISYNNREEDVPTPDSKRLLSLKDELLRRTKLAIDSIKSRPIPAIPSKERCSHCGVRHLCNDYWTQKPQIESLLNLPNNQAFLDIQLRLICRNGPSSWEAEIESSYLIPPAGTVLFRTQPNRPLGLEQGMRIRVLDAFFNVPVSETNMTQPRRPIATLGGPSEVFILPG